MTDVLLLLSLHFVGDFLLQSDWMATNKSKRWDALALHVGVYMLAFVPLLSDARDIGLWWAVNLSAHFVTDAATSRLTSRLWTSGARHWFFVVIGFDQLIHAWTLLLTWRWLVQL